MGASPQRAPLPPRWFVRLFWAVHRLYYRLTRGRRGLWRPTEERWGTMRLRTAGRRTGRERIAILAYLEEGPNLVTMAMNGWSDPEPAWWRNLLANPDAIVDLPGGSRLVHGRAANDDERARLWTLWGRFDRDLDAYAARRSRPTQVVILEPRSA